jgi:hypothetical protein
MVWHRVGSAAGLTACAGSSPALSAEEEARAVRLRAPCNLERMNPARTGR